jgi:two-component system, chemotaxis family, protein-glutamate methylesterase/glutaminase
MNDHDQPHRLIVAGASAGGPTALQTLLSHLQTHFPAAFLVVQHMAPTSQGLLTRLMAAAGPLPARLARDREPLRGGELVLAPPDHHLAVQANGDEAILRVTYGPRQNRARPSIDVLFRSAAVAYGARTAGVLLTGMLDDGVDGLRAIQRCGGVTIVQDPAEAEYPDMVQAALATMVVDYVLPLAEIAALLNRLAGEPVAGNGEAPAALRQEVAVHLAADSSLAQMAEIGEGTTFTCPDCGGRLWRKESGEHSHYACEIGHAYSEQSLLEGMDWQVERSLWVALRTLEERVRMLERMADDAVQAGRESSAANWRERADESRRDAENVRRFLLRGVGSVTEL